jgi:hypothetical protein
MLGEHGFEVEGLVERHGFGALSSLLGPGTMCLLHC